MNSILSRKLDFLNEHFSKIDFSSASVLDAGTGKGSAQLLISLKPQELTCVTFIGDLRKGNGVDGILKQTNNEKYNLVYGDLANSDLFAEKSFDYILADYLMGELDAGKVSTTLKNLFKWLKPNGKVFLVDREFHEEFKPETKYISMGEIKGDPELSKRSNRDICELPNIFLSIAKHISLLTEKQRNFDYPSEWIYQWLKEIGFEEIGRSFFDSSVNLQTEFSERLEWAKQRIEKIENSDLQKGLFFELEKIKKEFEQRNIGEEETFLRTQFLFEVTRKN